MSEVINDKEVYFDKYCPLCVRADDSATSDICNACLTVGFNQNSHKPINWKEGKKDVNNVAKPERPAESVGQDSGVGESGNESSDGADQEA